MTDDADERFHIAEWYGHAYETLAPERRVELANFKASRLSLSRDEKNRLLFLRSKEDKTDKETQRLAYLENKLEKVKATRKRCPFRSDPVFPMCIKSHGVCSLRIYSEKEGVTSTLSDERGRLRAVCPLRLHEKDIVFQEIGQMILNEDAPKMIGEVGFLESSEVLDSESGKDVGKIDMILSTTPSGEGRFDWCAVEIQTVYWSGEKMSEDMKYLIENSGVLKLPKIRRRPDYRSSGPKRLMPQLQIKVPTIRRWGKKLVVVVDEAFFGSTGEMQEVDDVSNCDIIWWIVDFASNEDGSGFEIFTSRVVFTTLERAIEGLTGGEPVTKSEFESRIIQKIDHGAN